MQRRRTIGALVGASFIVAISATPAAADHTAGTLDCGSGGNV